MQVETPGGVSDIQVSRGCRLLNATLSEPLHAAKFQELKIITPNASADLGRGRDIQRSREDAG